MSDPQYALDAYLRRLTDRLRRLEITVARARLQDSANTTYDNSASGLTSTDIQDAIDELQGEIDALPTDAELNIEGGQSVIKAHGSMGTAETFDPTDGNVHTGTLDDDCDITLADPTGTGAGLLELIIIGSGTNTWTWLTSVTWAGGTTPDPPGDGEVVRLTVEKVGSTWYGAAIGASSGSTSPLTTKGDLWGYTTTDARVAVDSRDGRPLVSDSTASAGVSYADPATLGHYEILMASGSASPLETSDGLDYLYVWVTD